MTRVVKVALSLLLIVIAIAAFNYPKFVRLYTTMTLFDQDKIVSNFSSMNEAFITLPITRSNPRVFQFGRSPHPLPEHFDYRGETVNTQAFLTRRSTTALLVIKYDNIAFEQYYLGTTADYLRISWSVGKSFISTLLGIDFGSRRLNEIYPDKKLAQAAFRNVQTGQFPLGSHGAGRSAMTGYFFGCNAHSGQGGAFKQIGDVKIAAFTVVNAFGAVVDRNGQVAACYQKNAQTQPANIESLFQHYLNNVDDKVAQYDPSTKNTTISLIVVNQKLEPALLKRLAVQVHTSMARGLQPYATAFDGDVVYAVSTAEIEQQILDPVTLATVAGEVMWDAILASVPEQPEALQPKSNDKLNPLQLKALTGKYTFSPFTALTVTQHQGQLYATASGERNVFAIKRTAKQPTELLPVSDNTFMVKGRYPLTLKFVGDTLIINPGAWQQVAKRS